VPAGVDNYVNITGDTMSGQLTSTVATGTAPFVVASTTRVSNLNVTTAGTADILTTGRTIGIGTGAVGTATSFNGSANITIPITGVSESYLTWGGKHLSGQVTPIGMSLSNELSANRIAFINGAGLDFEYSADSGTTWTNYNYNATQKSQWCTTAMSVTVGRISGEYFTTSRTRVTLTAQNGTTGYVYTNPRKMLINIASSGGMNVLVETRTGVNFQSSGAWSTVGTYSLSGWSGWNDIPLVLGTLGGGTTQTGNNWQLRLTFIMTTKDTNYPSTAQVEGIRIFGENAWQVPSTLAGTNDLYSFDMSQNAFFPGTVQGTRLISTIATGTSPLAVTSTTAVANLNADLLDGLHSTAFVSARTRSDWNNSTSVIGNVIGELAWKNYGNGHTIFDASNGTAPGGTAKNNTNPDVFWSATYPTLMGWNGLNTYGVRVDSARVSDSTTGNAATATTLQTARTINGVSFNGSANITVTAAPNAHTHAIADVTNLQTSLDAKINTSARNAANGVAPLDATSKVPVANLPDFITGAGRGFYLVGTISGAVSLSAASTGLVAQLVALSGGDYENMYGYMWTAAAEVTLTWTDQTTLGPTFQYHVLTPGDEGDSTSPVTLEAGDMIVFTKYSDVAGDGNDQQFTFSVINSSDPRFANYVPLTGGNITGTLNVSNTIGVGTTSPVLNSTGKFIHIHSPDTNASAIHFTNNTTGSGAAAGLIIGRWNDAVGKNFIYTYNNEPISFGTNNLERMHILGNGNVGIGTTAPAVKLHVAGGTRITGQLNVMGDAETKRLWVDFEDGNDMGTIQVVQDGVSYKNLALQPDGSNVGIATRTPSEKLEVVGNTKATTFISTQATGTAPLTVASTTAVTNLNADLLDGNHASAFLLTSAVKEQLKYLYIYGKAQSAITKGQAVQFAGVQGDHILIKAAVPSEINTNPDYFIGLAEATLATNDFGYVLTQGELINVNTSTYTAGNILWFASAGSTAGALTATEPTGTNAKIQVGAVTKVNATEGIILTRMHIFGVEIADIAASGTPSATTFLSGNGSWATPADATKLPLTGGTVTGDIYAPRFIANPSSGGSDTAGSWGISDYNDKLSAVRDYISDTYYPIYHEGNKPTATDVGLANVTNESKATMFSSPTFTGTVSGVTAAMVGLGNVTNESKATMFASPTFTGTVSGITAAMVGAAPTAGSTSITTLGTVTTGTWTASTIAVNRGGTGTTSLTSGSLLVGAGTGAVTTVAPKDLTDLGQLSSSSVVPTLERAVYYGTHQREIGVSSAIANSTSFTTITFTSGMRDFWLYIHQDSTTGSVIARIPLTITSAQSIGTATPGKQHRVAWSNGTNTQVMNIDIFFSGTTMSFRHNFTGASLAFRWFGY
jgi:hypothetical protein